MNIDEFKVGDKVIYFNGLNAPYKGEYLIGGIGEILDIRSDVFNIKWDDKNRGTGFYYNWRFKKK